MKKIILILLFSMAVFESSAQYSAVRVNTLALATGTINAGIDIAIDPRWSVEGSAY